MEESEIPEEITTQDSIHDLRTCIETLMNSTNGFLHRLDSIERLMDQNKFDYETMKIKINQNANVEHVQTLVSLLSLDESKLTIGTFLRALNRYLIHNDLVDLNDLEIKITPLLHSAFYMTTAESKVPYMNLLLGLPKMFVSK